MESESCLEKCTPNPKIQYLQIDDSSEYLISNKCFYPKNSIEFQKFINDFTLNPDKYLYYPEGSNYFIKDNKFQFKNEKEEIIKYNYIPICSVSGKLRDINNKKIASLIWSWNKNSFKFNQNTELNQKIENLKSIGQDDFKLRQFGLAFREQEFENPIDSAIFQASVYTAWFCYKLDGFKIFYNINNGGELVNTEENEKERFGVDNLIRPYTFVVLFK